ncbi:BgTH12-03133 [Blumeria graminis f. sp. triticale]|uniref:Bgt-1656 n=3 Tax=Blumeria graminis TaxID=34373 RepID=A0A061HN63_BLUGR|nr:Protein of the mitochondrial inner membrane [Blumeria graminis f. sp. tritici 96224]CAD6503469.1 BgTH12-03133 [Blumeria graminis f. sp. triticale]VDB89562.1 Bgt-1656 [Blumeria graminis f. sp. tritici]
MSSTSTTPLSSLVSLDTLFTNPVFAGGIGLGGLAAATAVLRRWTIKSVSLLKRRLLVNLEISKQDQSYQWILAWLTLNRSTGGRFTKQLTRINQLSMRTVAASAEKPARFLAQPGYGRHILKYQNAFVSVNRMKDGKSFNHSTGEPHETITLTTLYAHRHIFEDIFSEAHKLQQLEQQGKTMMLVPRGMDWVPFGAPRRKRPLDSVILDQGLKMKILSDVREFLDRQQWYVNRGIPYRRGYLLYGLPGSGKSSFIQALAGEIDFNIAMINLSTKGITDDKLADLLSRIPPKTILLLEDSDAAFINRRQVESDGYNGQTVTFSGLLNALDGITAGEERITFLTTNHIDRLDQALIRPGRVDMTVRIGEASRYQASEMWTRFYGDVDRDSTERERFLQKLEDLKLISDAKNEIKPEFQTSTAAIQGLFLFNKDNMYGAIEQAEGLIPRIYQPEVPAGIKIAA